LTKPRDIPAQLKSYYNKLYKYFGPRGWWPADTPFEVAIGAILTQNTAWINVEKAIGNLKNYNLLSARRLYEIDPRDLARLIRPAGYFNIKAKRLKSFIKWLMHRCDGDMEILRQEPLSELRQELIAIPGIGRETADSILLYALGKPVFVVDTYTYRVFTRHKLIDEDAGYEEIQGFFHRHLDPDPRLYNEYHAQIVQVGKTFCRSKPLCRKCPLKVYLPG
jgi:endonuclease-3 related protein